ncbi:hypothetical protein ADL01_26720, partial [Streptomyces sp. NRRL WC-3618]
TVMGVTETTHTQTKPGPRPAGEGLSNNPQFPLAMDELAGLRADLLDDTFAYHPLPPRDKNRQIAPAPLTRQCRAQSPSGRSLQGRGGEGGPVRGLDVARPG